ncbi:MAG TPA: tetratricopeptide repeat protein [Polyangiaceae bacterium]|jgi:TolA-binding protein|nr:tetratricopeptide repeat protein [Polyangiaceae bacterium]
MSDRRSFSEIPAELLRDHGDAGRVERGWHRLSGDLSHAPRRHRTFSPLLAVAATTFALGVMVGGRFLPHEPLPVPAFGAEPSEAPKPAARQALPAPSTSSRPDDAPRSRQAHRSAARRTDVTPRDDVEQAPAPEPAVAPTSTASSPSWQRLADEGQYAQALVSLEAGGGFDAALLDATADQLMSLVDVARATGQRQRAITALRRIVSEHGADPNAPVAAWMLGNELAKGRDFSGAEQAFAMYRALSPGGDFAEDALARQIDMAAEQGNRDHARRLAEQYLKEFPDGPRTADIQAELEQWGRAPSAPTPSAEHDVAPVSPDAGLSR